MKARARAAFAASGLRGLSSAAAALRHNLPSIFSITKINAAPPMPPPNNRYKNDQPAASTLGEGWNDLGRACVDLALAAAVVAIILAGELLTRHWFGAAHNAARDALLPSSPAEIATWLVLAVSAGFCEELVYRGYLLTQLRAFSGSLTLACRAQAALFGLAHAEQGPGVALRFGLYAVLLGALAIWRRSLLPGILAHVALDVSVGFLR